MTNIVHRMTPSSADLSKQEMKEGLGELIHKIKLLPELKVVVFNGRCVFDALLGLPRLKKHEFSFGVQPRVIIFPFFSSSNEYVHTFSILCNHYCHPSCMMYFLK